eukprot:2257869-Rhodomonas_salina.1
MSGTDVAYGLRARYAVSSTELAYGLRARYAVSVERVPSSGTPRLVSGQTEEGSPHNKKERYTLASCAAKSKTHSCIGRTLCTRTRAACV